MVKDRVVGQERLVDVGALVPSAVGRVPVGAEKTFRAYDPDQVLLISPVLAEWVPDGDLAHFVSDLVETGALDLGALYASYEGERGQPPYDPRLMVKLLLYGYATAVMSSRKLEAGTYRDIALRMLCADQHPDFRSIARFRARHLDALAGLFVQALRLCRQAGLVGLGALALDGTKLRANASRHKAMSYDRMGPKAEKLEAEIAELQTRMEALLVDAQATDAAEDEQHGPDRRGDELPAELARRETRLAAIREAMAALEDQAREAEQQRRAEMAEQGRASRAPRDGRDPFAPKPTAQRNFTDPDSKIMKTADGAFHQCFNGQAIVDSSTQVIVAADAFAMATDCPLLAPMLDQLADNVAATGARCPLARR
jgi:transposase